MITQMQVKSRRRQVFPSTQENRPPEAAASKGSLQSARVARAMPVTLCTVAEGASPAPERIAERAYQIWETNGRQSGTEVDDWLVAEDLLRIGG